jgi:nucleoid-associated protein YgaU
VKRGDSLFQLARLYYAGDIHQWRKILDANRDQIPDKDVLRVGQVLVIPD